MDSTVRVLAIRGIPIKVHASWLVVYGLITWTLAVGYFPNVLPDRPVAAYWANGLLAALLLFVSVLLHELSHSFVAIAHGLSVRGITLHVFGGVSHLEDEPPTPRAEFLIAVVGPITSFAVAAVLWAADAGGLVRPAWAQAVVAYLVLVNVVVGIFNLVPGFPLDGGRVLRAIVWKWTGTLPRATYLASRVGVGFAFGLMALGMLQIFGGEVLGGVWFIIIGMFLRGAADASYSQMALRDALSRLRVRDIMTRDVVTVPIDATVAQLADAFWAHHVTSFPVVDGAGVRGIASVQQVHAVPPEERTQRRVSEIMKPVTDDLVIDPDDPVFDALGKATRNEVGRLAVLSDSRLVGYLSLKDITHVLALRGLPDVASRGGAGGAPRGPAGRAA
ncbi:MAG TPA: site-2 protease family protein [Methylomirabilota bacterium]|nr:site-2 protease family protein [Methylomirabilota bacterium]